MCVYVKGGKRKASGARERTEETTPAWNMM